MATIIIKNSATPSQTPTSLTQGEFAINVTDGKLFYGSGSDNVVKEFTGSGGGGSTNTGSLLTTASVSLNTITFTKGDGSTFPITVDTGSGGGGSTFPYTGSAIISGSLTITGSLIVSNNIDSSIRTLYDSLGSSSVEWENRELFDNTNQTSVNWQLRLLSDNTGGSSVDWDARRLFTPNGTRAFEYGYTDYASRSNVYHQQNILATEQESLSGTNLEYSGHAIEATVDAAATAGNLIYLNTDGIWYTVDQATDTSTKLLGINIDGVNVLLEGDITINNIASPDHGLPLYIRQGNGKDV